MGMLVGYQGFESGQWRELHVTVPACQSPFASSHKESIRATRSTHLVKALDVFSMCTAAPLLSVVRRCFFLCIPFHQTPGGRIVGTEALIRF